MMKALLFCPVHGNTWAKRYFPDHPLDLLPFANKPAITYALDYCSLNGIRDIRIVSDEESGVLRMQFRRGEAFGLNLSYGGGSRTGSLKKIVLQNKSFCKDSDLLIFSGLFLPEYDKRDPRSLHIGANEMRGCVYGGEDGAAWYLVGRDRLDDLPDDWSAFRDDGPVCGSPVPGIRDYYLHNMRLAGSDIEKYNLPGFSMGQKSFAGRDVKIPGTARVKPPVILGNNIQFGRGCHAGPNIIVGDSCIIDNGTTIRNSVIFGNTYIGQDLEINGKICCGKRFIDPESGSIIDISNEALFSDVEPNEFSRCPFSQRILAFLLLLLQSLPYAVLRPFLEFHATLADCLVGAKEKRTLALHGYVLPREGFAGRLFRRLTLEKYHLLRHAAAGRLRLVGNCLLEATDSNERLVRDLPGYAPGVFSYSEYLGHENMPYQIELDEQYYAYAMDCWFNIKILTGILLRNLRMAGQFPKKGVME